MRECSHHTSLTKYLKICNLKFTINQRLPLQRQDSGCHLSHFLQSPLSLSLLSVRNLASSKLVAAPSCEHKFASCAITFKAHQTTLFGQSGRIKVSTTKIQNLKLSALSMSKFQQQQQHCHVISCCTTLKLIVKFLHTSFTSESLYSCF